MDVGVLGGGPWGMALAKAARRARSTVVLFSRRYEPGSLKGIDIVTSLAELAKARLIIIAVPSDQARPIARDLGEHLDGSHLLVHGIRGLSGDELQTISDILREETPVRRVGALGGPVQAQELDQGKPSAMVVGSAFNDVTAAVRRALSSRWLQLHATSDLRGLEWASALVGCLSIGLGYVQARSDVSPGLVAALISRAVDEAATIAVAAGAKRDTLYGLGGYGDLLASMVLHDRPEVILGRELANGATLAEARAKAQLRIEAIELVPRIARFAVQHGIEPAMFAALGDILTGDAEPEATVRALFVGAEGAPQPSRPAV